MSVYVRQKSDIAVLVLSLQLSYVECHYYFKLIADMLWYTNIILVEVKLPLFNSHWESYELIFNNRHGKLIVNHNCLSSWILAAI